MAPDEGLRGLFYFTPSLAAADICQKPSIYADSDLFRGVLQQNRYYAIYRKMIPVNSMAHCLRGRHSGMGQRASPLCGLVGLGVTTPLTIVPRHVLDAKSMQCAASN